MLLESLVTRVFLLSTTPPTHLQHSLLRRTGGGGGGGGGGFSKLPRIYMQNESSALYIQPKRTARKGVKARNKSAPSLVVEQRRQQKNDPSRDAAMLRVDWQKFCKSEVPVLVRNQMETIKELELELGEELTFGGPRGSLKGRPGAVEDHRHRAFYGTLSDSEEKLQNFAARQVACRVLGSKDYACGNCWLPIRDCMCQTLERGSLWGGVCLWLYMHPKDFLRKNNTGKLLWQVFGDSAARLTVCGIQEQEEAMWEVFKQAGRDLVWCVFPEKSPPDYHVDDIPIPVKETSESLKRLQGPGALPVATAAICLVVWLQAGAGTIHFVLIDGTWSNSKSMVSRLKERAAALWGESSMPCVALSPISVSVMHDLRPQPSTERTCTAAAAGQLLQELSMRSELTGQGLDQAAELVDAALDSLQNALVSRRSRDGRTTSRAARVYSRSGRSPL